jgi:hypothetical protein
MPKPRIPHFWGVVEERSVMGRSVKGTERGLYGSDHEDMSNEKWGENPHRRNSKVSWGRFVRPGLVGPKARPKGVVEGQRVNIPVLPVRV